MKDLPKGRFVIVLLENCKVLYRICNIQLLEFYALNVGLLLEENKMTFSNRTIDPFVITCKTGRGYESPVLINPGKGCTFHQDKNERWTVEIQRQVNGLVMPSCIEVQFSPKPEKSFRLSPFRCVLSDRFEVNPECSIPCDGELSPISPCVVRTVGTVSRGMEGVISRIEENEVLGQLGMSMKVIYAGDYKATWLRDELAECSTERMPKSEFERIDALISGV